MCLIINREENQEITEEFIRDVAQRNSDGWGFMYNHPVNDKVIVKRGLKLEEFFEQFQPVQERDIPCVIHFRMKTHGAVNLENCHPFEVTKGVYFMHNGTIDVDIPKKDSGKLSDTNVFVRDILKPMLLSLKDRVSSIRNPWFEHFMQAQASAHRSRYVLMDIEGAQFYGDWTKTTKGVWCSNTYAYTVDNPTKIYTPPVNNRYSSYSYGNYRSSAYDDTFDDLYWPNGRSSNNSRAKDAATKANNAFGTSNTIDYARMPNEDIVSYYRRVGITSTTMGGRRVGEEQVEFQNRIKGHYDNRIDLPKVLRDDVLTKILTELNNSLPAGSKIVSMLELRTQIWSSEELAEKYLDYSKFHNTKEVGKSVIPFQSQNTQEMNQVGEQTNLMTPLSEFQKNNGNESINKNGNEKEESVDESRDFLNATQTSDDPFCGLEDKDFYSGANTFIDLVSQLNSKSNEEIQNELEDELEKHLEQFETVAEEDWCLPSNEIEMLTDKIVSGELVFHYSSDGNSYLTDSGTVIYPEFMARKNVTNAL